jgi:hypothetical protein
MNSNLIKKRVWIPATGKVRGHYKTVNVSIKEEKESNVNGNTEPVEGNELRTNGERNPSVRERIERTDEHAGGSAGSNNQRIQPNVRYATSDQEYSQEGYKLGRWTNTVIPENSYVPDSLLKHINKAQRDFVNLAIDNFKKDNKTILNFDGTGTGKTRQEIGLAETYLKENPNAKILIVTESESIITNAFNTDAKIMGSSLNRIKSGEGKSGEINITTYSMLKNIGKEYDLVIFDESHNLKNSDSEKSKQGLEFILGAKNVAMFSATPVDKPEHLHYIASALQINFSSLMDMIGMTSREYKKSDGTIKISYEPKSGYNYKNVAEKIEAFFNTITDRGLAVKREVELKNLKTNINDISIPEEYIDTFNQAYNDYENYIDSIENPMFRGIAKATGLMKLRGMLESFKAKETIKRTIESIKNGEQVVIVGARTNETVNTTFGKEGSQSYSHDAVLQSISDGLKAQGIEVVDYFGSKKDKTGVFQFQSGKAQVFITTPQSGGTGISLDDVQGDKPRRMFLTSLPFSANNFVQVLGRINRKNTKSPAFVELMYVDHPIDNWNKSVMATKLVTLGATVEGDYSRINADTLALVESVDSESVAKEIINSNSDLPLPKVVANNRQVMDYNILQKPTNVIEKKKGQGVKFKSFKEFLSHVPFTPGDIPNVNVYWKDANITISGKDYLMSDLIRTQPKMAFSYIKKALSRKGQDAVESGKFNEESLSKIRFMGQVTGEEKARVANLQKSVINEGVDFLIDFLMYFDQDFQDELMKAVRPGMELRPVRDKRGNRVNRWFKIGEAPPSIKFRESKHFGEIPSYAKPNEIEKLIEIDKVISSGNLSQAEKEKAIKIAKDYISKIKEAKDEFKKDGIQISADLRFKIMRKPGEGKEINLKISEIETLLKHGQIGIVSAGRNPKIKEDMELTDEQISKRDEDLKKDLIKMGFQFVRAIGTYEGLKEESFIFFLPEAEKSEVIDLGAKYNQDSVVFVNQGHNQMIFTTGEDKGKAYEGTSFQKVSKTQEDFFTEVVTPRGRIKFNLDFNFERKVEVK